MRGCVRLMLIAYESRNLIESFPIQSRQHSGDGGDEEFFFTGFGDQHEYDTDDGQHGSGRDYDDYFGVSDGRTMVRLREREIRVARSKKSREQN